MSDIFTGEVTLVTAAVGGVVVIAWLGCCIQIIRFRNYRRQHPRTVMRMALRNEYGTEYNTTTTGIKGDGKDGQTTMRAGMTSTYTEGMTTMLAGATTIMTSNELSIPAFLAVTVNVDFQMGRIIARGGAGVIHQATATSPAIIERSQNEPIVAKSFGESLSKMEDDYRNAFYQELSLMWRFRQHPGFVRVYGYSETPAVIIMKFYRYGSLADFIHNHGEASVNFYYTKRYVHFLFTELCYALNYMHHQGYVHSDIKPGNVLLDVTDDNRLRPVLSDFGICQIVAPTEMKVKAFRVSQAIGASLAYAAPEILRFLRSSDGLKADERLKLGDVYAMACVLHEMLTRRVPWK